MQNKTLLPVSLQYIILSSHIHPELKLEKFLGEVMVSVITDFFKKILQLKKQKEEFFKVNCLPLLWWCLASKCSENHDWHCLFCGRDLAPVSKEMRGKKLFWGRKKKSYPLIGCSNVNPIL